MTTDFGQRIGPVEVGPIAHGGHCVARHDGRVIFVRHALPGERVMITVTDDSHDRFWRADAVEILVPSPDRVERRCAISGPGLCGGCDFQHVDLAAQRQLKRQVVAEQLQRLAGITWHGEVEEVTRPEPEGLRPEPVEGPPTGPSTSSGHDTSPCDEVQAPPRPEPVEGPPTGPSTSSGHDTSPCDEVQAPPRPEPVEGPPTGPSTSSGHDSTGPGPGHEDGLGWRTRMRYQVDDGGRAGLRVHRSHEVIALPQEGCPIADPRTPDVVGRSWTPGFELIAAATSTGQTALFEARTARNQPALVERAAGRDWRVAADGFWQVHPAAAQTLVDAVIEGLNPQPAERVFDLYCGVGLFAGALVDAGCQVWGIESDRQAIRDARSNLRDASDRVKLTTDRVDRVLPNLPRRVDLVVLDPPRSGAGRAIITQITARGPRGIAYVACDPAALARDLGTARDQGYDPISIRALDLFPMTHHIECVAILTPGDRQ